MSFKFEKLIVWQKAIDLSLVVNEAAKHFPDDERYVLRSTGQSNAEFRRFLNIALRSNIEVVGCIYLAKKRNIILNNDFEIIYKSCEEILVMINGLKNSLH